MSEERMGDLLEKRLEDAARRLEADPELPGWVLGYVTDLAPRSGRAGKRSEEARAAARRGLYAPTLRVQVGDGWNYFTFASRTPDLTPEEVARILTAYLAPGAGGDDGRYTAGDEASAAAARDRDALGGGREVGGAPGGGAARALLRALAAAIAVGGVAALVWLSSLWWQPALENRDHRLPFESAAWKAHSKDAGPMWPTRLRMGDDLLGSGVLRGKTRAEVEALLGPPDSAGSAGAGATEVGYYLGPERGAIRIDSEVLSVRFGPDGRVADCYIWRD